MSSYEQVHLWSFEVNQTPTTSVNWFHASDRLDIVLRRNQQAIAQGTSVSWLLVGLYPTIRDASAAAAAYREEHASHGHPSQ